MKRLRPLLLGVTGCLLAVELLLQWLPVSSATMKDYYLDPMILSYPARHHWTLSTGWDLRNARHHVANNAGFLASRDFQRDPNAVALIGDSFVEASALAPADRPDAQLERALGDRPVYGMGAPGSSLLDYLERIRWAHQQYGIRDFVLLLEGGDLKQGICGSGNVHGPCLAASDFAPRTETAAAPDLSKRLLRHLALPQYLLGQLMISPQRLWQQAKAQARPPEEAPGSKPAPTLPARTLSAAEQAVAQAFFARLQALQRNGVRVLLVVDAKRALIYAGQAAQASQLSGLRPLADAAGVKLLDSAPTLAAHYQREGLSFDVGPYDGHYNRLGVQLVMQAAARELQAAH